MCCVCAGIKEGLELNIVWGGILAVAERDGEWESHQVGVDCYVNLGKEIVMVRQEDGDAFILIK